MRTAWVLAIAACSACGGANRSEYATAAGFAGAAAVVEAVQMARKDPSPPPCGQEVLVCRGASERVCTTDANGCELCSCQRAAGDGERLADPNAFR